jgi:predicted nucleic acid-binding Zn ribbon protein
VRNPPKKPKKYYRDKNIWKDCIFCGETFHKKNPNHRACSKKCQRKWHNVTTMVKKYMGN